MDADCGRGGGEGGGGGALSATLNGVTLFFSQVSLPAIPRWSTETSRPAEPTYPRIHPWNTRLLPPPDLEMRNNDVDHESLKK